MAIKKSRGKGGEQPNADGDMTDDELQKAMDLLEDTAQSTEDERETLLQKALDDEITDEENERLRALLAGDDGEENPSLAKSATAALQPENNEKLKKSLDVSTYLDGMYEGTMSALAELAETIEKSDTRQHNFNVVLARGVRALGILAKSLDERMEAIETQPVGNFRARRSTSQPKALEKSFAGKEPEGETLSKSQVLDTLEEMHVESIEKGNNGHALCGEDLNKAITKYESTRRLSRPLFEELKSWRSKKQAA